MKETQIRLKNVDSTDLKFLYKLLKQRDPKQNISHRKMPSYIQHVKFISSKPYAFWYILVDNEEKVGSVYLTDLNEIGISLIKTKNEKELEREILKSLMKKHPLKKYFINISSKNKKLEIFVKKFGFKMIQKTYKFEK